MMSSSWPRGATSRHATVEGQELHYLDFGGPLGSPSIVAVHGLGGSALNFGALGPMLSHHHRILALDLPGHGRVGGRPSDSSDRRHRRSVAECGGAIPSPRGRRSGDPRRTLARRCAYRRTGSTFSVHRGQPGAPRSSGSAPDPPPFGHAADDEACPPASAGSTADRRPAARAELPSGAGAKAAGRRHTARLTSATRSGDRLRDRDG